MELREVSENIVVGYLGVFLLELELLYRKDILDSVIFLINRM